MEPNATGLLPVLFPLLTIYPKIALADAQSTLYCLKYAVLRRCPQLEFKDPLLKTQTKVNILSHESGGIMKDFLLFGWVR